MIAMRNGARRRPGAMLALALLLPLLSTTVPLLDRGARWYAPVFAPEQGYSSGAIAHDHTICVQFAANATLAPPQAAFHFIHTSTSIADPPRDHRVRAARRIQPRSRSPPFA
jgi:hypothetical protein